jgi:hypothetical protein
MLKAVGRVWEWNNGVMKIMQYVNGLIWMMEGDDEHHSDNDNNDNDD